MKTLPTLLFQSKDFVVIDKPAGWLSIPARTPKPGDRVVGPWLHETLGTPIRIIHRLDRFTSGVMILALDEAAQREAALWFEKREVKKSYLFIAAPVPDRPAIQIRSPIQGKPAQTLFEVLEKKIDRFKGKATPLTGRFHQIRDHAAIAGFPLLGDIAYHGRPASRVCLHAASLITPIGEFQAPFPADLETIWNEPEGVGP